MTFDILNWIQQMLAVRGELQELDSEKLYRYYPPNEGCSAEDILQVENQLGIVLDKQYKKFLRCADGWKEFFTSINLFGTKELLSGPEMDMAKDLLKIVYPLNPQLEFKEEELLPIAVDEVGRCFFVLTPSVNGKDGTVIWFAGQVVEKYDSFNSFLSAVLQYNIDDLEEFRYNSHARQSM